jgi:hypothetical protein
LIYAAGIIQNLIHKLESARDARFANHRVLLAVVALAICL